MSQDSVLQRAVLAELNWDPSVPSGHVGVAVENGAVTLTGHVASYAEKRAAEAAALRVKGVKAVAEDIEVRLPHDSRRDDSDIAAAAGARLASDVCVPHDAVKAKVEDGFVTLTGEVDWHYQKESARDDVSRLPGVIGVSDQIRIRAGVNVETIGDDITHALHRSWFFDPKTVTVSAEGGVVRLGGTVHTPHERQVAAATAWAAPGVTDVRNEIVIA